MYPFALNETKYLTIYNCLELTLRSRCRISLASVYLLQWYRVNISLHHGPLARYVKLPVAHAPGMPGTFSPPPRDDDPDMHHGTCVTHVSWCMPGSLTSRFLWTRWRGKRSRHSRRTRNPQFYVSGKRPIVMACLHRQRFSMASSSNRD